MSVAIRGMAWVTPLGNELEAVWQRLAAGERGEVKQIGSPDGKLAHFYVPVPPKQVEAIGRMPRLRRSSAISYFTAAAGLAALENAGITMTPDVASRTAVVFAISSGGVVYSRRFYETIVAKGANAASPLLFPETVYNAPASHLAALFGIDGASYTVVGDASAGISAIEQAAHLIETGEVDQCVVVGGEEVDWVLCEAYAEWRLTSRRQSLEVYATTPGGMLLGEGAAALVLAREGVTKIGAIHSGTPIFRRTDAPEAARAVCATLAASGRVDLVVGSANGTYVDTAEAKALRETLPEVAVTCPKAAFGDALGAGALLQIVVGALAIQRQEAPAVPAGHPARGVGLLQETMRGKPIRRVAVPVIGLNQQASGLVLEG